MKTEIRALKNNAARNEQENNQQKEDLEQRIVTGVNDLIEEHREQTKNQLR